MNAESLSPDGQALLFNAAGLGLGMWSLATQQSTPLAQSPSTDFEGSVSPDGQWLAYTSRVTGRPEVYVTSFPKPGRQISNAGSTQAQWRADGRELFYVENDAQIMAVVVRTAVDAFAADLPHQLFQRRLTLPFRNRFVVTRDGQRFLVNTAGRRKRSESAANGGRQLAGHAETTRGGEVVQAVLVRLEAACRIPRQDYLRNIGTGIGREKSRG